MIAAFVASEKISIGSVRIQQIYANFACPQSDRSPPSRSDAFGVESRRWQLQSVQLDRRFADSTSLPLAMTDAQTRIGRSRLVGATALPPETARTINI